jgi:hypothetical protein
MTITDGVGYIAASLVLATFCAKRMVSLRALAISSNVAFITYGLAAQLWPIVILRTIMLPLNVIRLRDALAALDPPSCACVSAAQTDQMALTQRQPAFSSQAPRSRIFSSP